MAQASLVLHCREKLSRYSLSCVEFENSSLPQVNYLCGQLAPDLFLRRGASLLMAGLMDYYTVPVWTDLLLADILNSPSCANCFDNWADNDEYEEGRMLVCSR